MQGVSRAAAILRVLSSAHVSLGYIAKATGLPRSTVQRLVNALAVEELVEVTNDGISLSWGIMRLAEAAQSSLLDKFRSAIETMFQETHETVDFSTVYGKEVTYIEKIHSDQEIRVSPKPGAQCLYMRCQTAKPCCLLCQNLKYRLLLVHNHSK